MQAELLLPDAACLRLDAWTVEGEVLVLRAATTQPVVYCPDCSQPSRAVHSYYERKPADVPCPGYPMRIELCVRRFYCHTESCERTTFAERIPAVVGPYARRTSRLVRDQTQVAFVAGGEAGSRLLTLLRMRASPDTRLRLIRRTPIPVAPPSRLLGIDDWALCKGQRYGTIPVDLEHHQANASQLWREIRHQGLTGSRGRVAHWAVRARNTLPSKTSSNPTLPTPQKAPMTPRQASWLLVKTDKQLSQEEQAARQRMTTVDAQVAQVRTLAQSFIAMVKDRQPQNLGPWLKSITDSGISVLQRFADGLRKDLEAVMAALTLPWSQGQVEGWVNKLKFIKRAMYGRANFDLLRQRVLAA